MADSSGESSTVQAKTSEPLAADIEKQLAAIPDDIGEPDAIAGPEVEGESFEEAAVALSNKAKIQALIDLGYLDEEDAAELFDDLFEWIAGKAGSDHWKLKPNKQRDKLARAGAACANSALQKIFDALPDAAGEGAAAHPEVTALLLALGTVAVPKALKQLKVRREGRGGGAVKVADRKPVQGSGPLGAIPITAGRIE